jgi:hypothetical protein
MGVSSTTNTEIYSGDGSTTSFAFPFYFFETTDLYVYIYDTVAGGITPQVLGTNFTISGTPNNQGLYPNGANVVFGTAPVNTVKVVISRFPLEVQDYALLQNGLISATALVQEFDYLTLLIQSLQDQINRCVQLPPGFAPPFNPQLPSTAALSPSELLGVNALGTGLELTAGIPGPAGPPGTSGGSGLRVTAAVGTTVLTAGSPVDSNYAACDASGGAMSLELPATSIATIGQVVIAKKIDNSANAATILPNGSDQILTTGLVGSLALDYQGKSYSLVCRAAGFWDVF